MKYYPILYDALNALPSNPKAMLLMNKENVVSKNSDHLLQAWTGAEITAVFIYTGKRYMGI